MPNSVPHIEEEMLRELGLSSVEELYRTVIPEDLLFQGTMDLPAPLLSEQALKRHVSRLLAKNTSTEDAISFLGAGCYKRYIPAVCDEIANRSEFLTAYCGDTYSDHGKMQAIFEYWMWSATPPTTLARRSPPPSVWRCACAQAGMRFWFPPI